MKIARVGSVCSFSFFFIAGMRILAIGSGAERDAPIVTIMGLCLLGFAFFTGSILWVAGEKVRQQMTLPRR